MIDGRIKRSPCVSHCCRQLVQLPLHPVPLCDAISYHQLITGSGTNPLSLQTKELPQAIAHNGSVPHGPRRTIPRTILRCPIVQAQANHILHGDIVGARHHLSSSDTLIVDSGGSHRPEPNPVVRDVLWYRCLAIPQRIVRILGIYTIHDLETRHQWCSTASTGALVTCWLVG